MKKTITFLLCVFAACSLFAQHRNMLLNADFENELTNGWIDGISGKATIISDGGIRGKSLKVVQTTDIGSIYERRIINQQQYAASYGEQFQVTFKAKATGTGSVTVKPEFNTRISGNYTDLFSNVSYDGREITLDGIVRTYTFQSNTVVAQADYMDFLLNFNVSDGAELIIDDVELIRVSNDWSGNVNMNGDFTQNINYNALGGYFMYNGDGSASSIVIDTNNKTALVSITASGTTILTERTSFPDERRTAGKKYRVRFDAEITSGSNITGFYARINSTNSQFATQDLGYIASFESGIQTYISPNVWIMASGNNGSELYLDVQIYGTGTITFHKFYLEEVIDLISLSIDMPQEVLVDATVPVGIWANPTSADNAVTLSVDDGALGVVTQNSDGTWSYEALAEGAVTITATSKADGTKTDAFTVNNVTAATWGGKTNKWDDGWYNWTTREAPNSTIDVVIPKVAAGSFYPMLETGKSAGYYACNTITFEPGAEIGRQDLLAHASAKVEYDLKPGRWHMLSVPVSDITTGDFSLRIQGNDQTAPKTWLRKFEPKNDVAEWPYYKETTEPLAIGEGFSFWIEDQNGTGTDPNAGFSIKGSLAGNTAIPRTLSFATLGETFITSPFAFAGNPYMTSIDFNALRTISNGDGAKTNGDIISANYIIHNGDAFVGYTPDGNWGATFSGTEDRTDRIIPPLQAFIVEAATSVSGTQTIRFGNLASLQATGKSLDGLRKADASYGKLDIVAENGTIPVLTFIANREGGKSARKLKSAVNAVPDIYTLAPDNETALGAQLIDSDMDEGIVIPLGIATSKVGEMTLNFSGMETYPNVDIKLIDREMKTSVDLNEQPVYNFTYTPPTHPTEKDDKGNPLVTADESRFAIAFSPSSITGLEQAREQKVVVSVKGDELQVLGSTDNFIKEVLVYTMQGQLLFADYAINRSVYTTVLSGGKRQGCLVKVISEKSVQTVKLVKN